MAETFYFPRINVSLLAIPKTGSTSLKNYLFTLETLAAESMGENLFEEYKQEMQIYLRIPASKFLVKGIESRSLNSSFRILVLRNPYERALSGWANKLLYAKYSRKHKNLFEGEDFVPGEFESIEDLNNYFDKFATRLALDKDFLHMDPHWLPQHEAVPDLEIFNLTLETQGLSKIPDHLSKFVDSSLISKAGTFPNFNDTDKELVSFIGSSGTWDSIKTAYLEDIDLLTSLKMSNLPPALADIPSKEFEADLISRHKQIIENERQYSEYRSLQIELEHMRRKMSKVYLSKSWKITAWLRWLENKVTGKPKPKPKPNKVSRLKVRN